MTHFPNSSSNAPRTASSPHFAFSMALGQCPWSWRLRYDSLKIAEFTRSRKSQCHYPSNCRSQPSIFTFVAHNGNPSPKFNASFNGEAQTKFFSCMFKFSKRSNHKTRSQHIVKRKVDPETTSVIMLRNCKTLDALTVPLSCIHRQLPQLLIPLPPYEASPRSERPCDVNTQQPPRGLSGRVRIAYVTNILSCRLNLQSLQLCNCLQFRCSI